MGFIDMKTGRTSKKFILNSFFWAWLRQHKLLAGLVAVLVVIAGLVIGYNVIQYRQKFSLEDYDHLTAMAQTVLKNSGGRDIQVDQSCSYQRPSEYASLRLFCSVELVTYLPYVSADNAVVVAKSFKASIKKNFPTLFGDTSRFIDRPDSGYSDISVVIQNHRQCNFQIGSNKFASNIAPFLPRKASTGLIGMYFECSAESRAEYFPVTYRQG